MMVTIYRGHLTLMEHVFFSSREVGNLYETEPVLGNYALAYALGFCHAPYHYGGPPRYKEDLGPLNQQGIYVTPGTFDMATLRYAFTQFNGQTDSFYFRFDQNAIATMRGKRARAANFPQSGKIRMLALASEAYCFLIDQQGADLRLPSYIRLGKFNSKARVRWERLRLAHPQPVDGEETLDYLINAADLSPALVARLRAFSLYNLYPAPLISRCRLGGMFWHSVDRHGKTFVIPSEMRFGVEAL